MNNNAKILLKVILGSTRPGRFGDKPAKWILEEARKQPGVEVELLDLRDYQMPFFNEPHSLAMKPGVYSDPASLAWSKKIAEADGFILVCPEYNHGPSAVLKNALDYAYTEWNKKPVGFVAYGSVGGARAVEQLRGIVTELQMVSVRNAVHIISPWFLVDEKGDLKPGALDAYKDAASGMLTQLVWWAKALKSAREEVASTDHVSGVKTAVPMKKKSVA